MFLRHWTDVLECCVLDHEKELVKDHGETNSNPFFLRGRMHITLQAPQCPCLLPTNGGRGRGQKANAISGKCVCFPKSRQGLPGVEIGLPSHKDTESLYIHGPNKAITPSHCYNLLLNHLIISHVWVAWPPPRY